jgi:predicted metal-dependent HD superfamily phosphohydrolase
MSLSAPLAALPFTLPLPLEQALRVAYAVPARAYHSFAHVEEVLGHYASVRSLLQDPVSVALAVLFHDAVYQLGTDNEAASAQLAAALVPAHLPRLRVDLARVQELILLTARHGKLGPEDVDADAALFLDCDMAILGSPWPRFQQYDLAIASEYSALPRDVYQAGRERFLRGLLARDVIYLSDFFRQRFEQPARSNLQRSLAGGEAAS